MQPRHSRPDPLPRKGELPQTGAPSQKPIEFTLDLPDAQTVVLAGTFNNWNLKRTPMRKEGGRWKATVSLPPGRHEYRFVADGRWLSDPNAKESAANPFGENNSVIIVS